jgi:glucose/arabinose dehydrogenase
MNWRIALLFLLVVIPIALYYLISRTDVLIRLQRPFFRPTETSVKPGFDQKKVMTELLEGKGIEETKMVIAKNLKIPWEIVLLPDGGYLIPERDGHLYFISNDNESRVEIQGVRHKGEGGLLGAVIHPQFSENRFLYLYLTTQSGDELTNQVERYTLNLEKKQLENRTVILANIPGAANHDGGRLVFSPDGKLFVTTGDAQQPALAQNTQSLAGKILRVNDDGSIPTDNPFGNAVYSYGHRNPQGLAWDVRGRLWETEHGPSGAETGNDEINVIEKGKNYGWPEIRGKQQKEGMVTPVLESGTDDTWAPGGAIVWEDHLVFTGLRGERLYLTHITDDGTLGELYYYFAETFGRLRAIALDPSGDWFYLATSNTDGRGTPQAEDDKVFKLNISLIHE